MQVAPIRLQQLYNRDHMVCKHLITFKFYWLRAWWCTMNEECCCCFMFSFFMNWLQPSKTLSGRGNDNIFLKKRCISFSYGKSVTLAYLWFLTPLIRRKISFFRCCLELGKELPQSGQACNIYHWHYNLLYSVVEALQSKIDMHLKDYVTLIRHQNNIPVCTLASTKIPQTLYF